MKFIALVSGGKDSIFNIIKCRDDGHELVAVCNLYNKEEGSYKDSYMYQTVGTNVVRDIAEALDVPFYRREIVGTPKLKEMEYTGDKVGDYVYDLYELVRYVKMKHPDIEGVSSGAIASTYQKKRVEDVCSRLGLKSLAYLWYRYQVGLLQEMIDRGMESILIKVACYGLDSNHLNKSLREIQPYLLKLKAEFEMNVCGEGGYYESLTLNCPIYKKKIEILESEIVYHDKNQFAPVAYLKIHKTRLVYK